MSDDIIKRIHKHTPKEPKETYDIWFDETAPDQEFTHKEFLKRLKEVHKITTTNGTRRMLMHMDGAEFFASVWEWEIEGKTFVNSTRNKRTGMDKAMWGGGYD